MPSYIVAAPHCYCSKLNPIRHCDRVANRAVSAIVAADTGSRIVYTQLSDKLRRIDHDYNRPNTDDTPWRAQLRDNIITRHPDFVFEVHSFPGDHEMYRTRWPGATSSTSCDLALFRSDDNASWIDLLAEKIRNRAPLGSIVRVVKPWHPVAITDDIAAIKKSTPECANTMHTLIEFNEVADILATEAMAAAVYSAVDELVRARDAVRKESIFGGDTYAGKYVFDPAIMHPAALDSFSNVSGKTFVSMMLALAFIILTLIGLAGYAIGKYFTSTINYQNMNSGGVEIPSEV